MAFNFPSIKTLKIAYTLQTDGSGQSSFSRKTPIHQKFPVSTTKILHVNVKLEVSFYLILPLIMYNINVTISKLQFSSYTLCQ